MNYIDNIDEEIVRLKSEEPQNIEKIEKFSCLNNILHNFVFFQNYDIKKSIKDLENNKFYYKIDENNNPIMVNEHVSKKCLSDLKKISKLIN